MFQGLRGIPGLKSLWVSLVWANLAFIPALDSNLGFTASFQAISVMIFSLVFTLMIAFDIRDIASDDANLKTLPQVLGIKGAKCVGGVLLFLCMSSAMFGIALEEISNHLLLLWLVVNLYTGILLYKSKPVKSELFYEGFVDGTLVILCLAYVVN